MELAYRLEIRSPLPHVAQDQLRDRFGEVRVQSEGDRTLLSGHSADQAALRAVLSLLWDVGVEVLVVEATPLSDHDGKRSDHDRYDKTPNHTAGWCHHDHA